MNGNSPASSACADRLRAMQDSDIARGLRPGPLSRLVGALATAYLALVFLEAAGSGKLTRALPRMLGYFTQVACLFPHAASMSIGYRAEGWLCGEKRWVEIDVRPYFVIDPDDKENRFHRVMFFYRENRPTMTALEDYLVARHNLGDADDGAPKAKIGGVRLLSLRVPFGKAGDPVERHSRRPLASYPEEQRKNWFWTPASRRDERCAR
jgi:hypothetical protein